MHKKYIKNTNTKNSLLANASVFSDHFPSKTINFLLKKTFVIMLSFKNLEIPLLITI